MHHAPCTMHHSKYTIENNTHQPTWPVGPYAGHPVCHNVFGFEIRGQRGLVLGARVWLGLLGRLALHTHTGRGGRRSDQNAGLDCLPVRSEPVLLAGEEEARQSRSGNQIMTSPRAQVRSKRWLGLSTGPQRADSARWGRVGQTELVR